MARLRYDAPVDPDDSNNSHAIVIDLVGRNRRVLDVGCATGTVGEVLIERGCEVVGIELDPEAAMIAKGRLSDVVVGSALDLDLERQFGAASFDVVVAADVLEHLPEPEVLLRRLVRLLRPEGFVVVSLPNVAHGAIRLALVDGRFAYTDVGLLDRTHLRFFTRDGVDDLLADAGLAPADVRRTTAGLFETEVKLDPSSVDDGLVARIEAAPEATTYQFVVKAVRDDATHAVRSLHQRVEEQEARIAELEGELGRRIVDGAAVRLGPGLQVGIWGFFDTDDPQDALRGLVVEAELRRRLPTVAFRAFAPFGLLRPALPLPGWPLEPLGERTKERTADLSEHLDAVVTVGELSARLDVLGRRYGPAPGGEEHPATFLGAGDAPSIPTVHCALRAALDPARDDDARLAAALRGARLVSTSDEALAQLLSRVGVPAELIPDPLLLLPRLAQSFDVAVRRSALRSSTPLLEGSYIVVHGSSPDAVPAVARAVERLRSERPDLQVVTANLGAEDGEGGFSAALAAEGVEAIGEGRMRAADVVALVAGARVVASSARWVRSIANAFGVPAVATSTREGAFADSGVLLGAASRRSTPPAADVAVVDAHLDRLAELLREVAPADGSVAPRLVLDRLAALDRALAEADHEPRWLIHELLERLEEARILGRDTAARLGAETARRTAAEGAAAELAALEATRTFRATRRLRAFYGAVRARLPRLPG